MTDLEKAIENVPKVYEAGQERVWNDFWDDLQNYGKLISYKYRFYGWKDEWYNPKHHIYGSILQYTFSYSSIKDTKVDIIFDYRQHGDNFYAAFEEAKELETIRKIKITGEHPNITWNRTFQNCIALKNIIIEGSYIYNNVSFQWSPLLSKASIKNIVSILADSVTGKTLSLNQTAVNNAFETAEGLADGSSSAEWIALRGTKTNWTISLV